jgi:hypothetical protein
MKIMMSLTALIQWNGGAHVDYSLEKCCKGKQKEGVVSERRCWATVSFSWRWENRSEADGHDPGEDKLT